nr:hypothetical protein [Tanacetum cinerariifolium]
MEELMQMIARKGKGFLGVETPLFEGMLVKQEVDEERDADEHVEEVNAGDAAQGDDFVALGEVPTVQPPSPQPQPHQAADFPTSLFQEALDACATLTRRVEHLELDKVAQALEITKLKKRVKKLEKRNKVRVLKLRRLHRVKTSQRVDTFDDTMMDDESNQERMIVEMDKDDVVVLMDENKEDKKVEEAKVDNSAQDQGKQAKSQAKIYKIDIDHANKVLSIHDNENEPAEVQEVVDVVTNTKLIIEVVTAASEPVTTASQARKNMIMYLKNVVGFKMDYFKGMSYDDIRLIFEAKFNSNVAFFLKTKEQIKEEENTTLQKINETLAERAYKRRKLDKEVEDLKRHLEIVPNEDDDVYTKATPLARKVPVVNYQVIEMNNKPYYKIIRADGIHQLYISFLTLLKNFDREDLEALWSLVKERFSTSKPKNFFDAFLLTTLGAMFETPDVHAQI